MTESSVATKSSTQHSKELPSSSPTLLPQPKPNSSSVDSTSSASSPPALCAICATNTAKYTCPRCHLRTCSLPCSQTHKALGAGCSGVRNKAAYVPMNQYGYMALMDDYVYLEEVGRMVSECGREIVNGGYQAVAGEGRGRGRGRGKGNMRGRGRGQGRGGHSAHQGTRTKRDILKMELDYMDIEMDLLPVGMERRILNQSAWDLNNKTALLTVEFVFHPPRFLLPSSHPPNPIRMLTHRNRLSDSLMTNLTGRLAERAGSKREKDKPLPEWLTDMLVPNLEDPDAFVKPICVMPTKLDPLASLTSHTNPHVGLRPGHITRNAFYKLAYDKPLAEVLKHKQFVEFPTIQVWEEGAFTGTVVDDQGSIVRKYDGSDDDDAPKPKRRRLGQKEGKKALGGLLGGYGSASDDEEENEKEEKNVLSMLSGYAGSDDEGQEVADTSIPETGSRVTFESQFDYELGDEDAEGETDDGEGEVMDDEDGWAEDEMASGGALPQSPEALAALLEQLRQAGTLRDPVADSHSGGLAGLDEEQVDWGDSADEDEG